MRKISLEMLVVGAVLLIILTFLLVQQLLPQDFTLEGPMNEVRFWEMGNHKFRFQVFDEAGVHDIIVRIPVYNYMLIVSNDIFFFPNSDSLYRFLNDTYKPHPDSIRAFCELISVDFDTTLAEDDQWYYSWEEK